MTDTAVRQTESASATAAELQQQAAIAAAERVANTLLQVYIQEGRVAMATSTQAKAAAQAAADKIIAACRASVTAAQESGSLSDSQAAALHREIDRIADDLTPAVVRVFMESLAEALDNRAERIDGEEDTSEARRRWASNAGATLASRLVAEHSQDFVKPVEEALGAKLHKLWMSRGDNKVRGSHRKLHGSTAELDKPFWRELGTGKVLAFPGDPRAPIEQTINCRCWLWYVPESQAADAETTFKMPESEFELIAASGHGHGSMWDLDDVVIDAAVDVMVGLVAAETRRYDEEQHERSAIGQFARKPVATLEEDPNARRSRRRSEYKQRNEAWARSQGYRSLADWQRKRGGANDGDGGGSGRGSSGGSGGGGDGNAAAREAERTNRRNMMNERRTAAEKLRAHRRMEDARKRGQRLTEDEALYQIQEEIREVKRPAREKQRESDQSARDIERSRDYIKQMRLRGENPAIIQAETARLLGLENKHKEIIGEVKELFAQSRKLGTSDEVRKLRDRVRFSRRAEDDKIRTDREQMDAAIRLKNQQQDEEQRAREEALRARRGAGELVMEEYPGNG